MTIGKQPFLWTLVILFLCVSITVTTVAADNISGLKDYLAKMGLESTTKWISDQMALSMPMQVDSFTRLTKVNYLYPDTIIVFARISLTKQQISDFASLEEIRQQMKQDTTRRMCADPTIETMLQAGMRLTYEYLDDNRLPLFSLTTKEEDCTTRAARL
jgi:hypothetical protein